MVLDDDDDRRGLLLSALAGAGHRTRGVKGVAAARQLLERWTCDLVMGSQSLSGLDGAACLQVLKEQYPQSRFLIVVDDIRTWRQERQREACLDGCLFRPFDIEDLHAAVAAALGGESDVLAVQRLYRRARKYAAEAWRGLRESWLRYRLKAIGRWRDRCFQEFLTSVRSGGLAWGGALIAWDRLEELDEAWRLADTGRVSCGALEENYRYLWDFMVSYSHSPHRLWPGRRENRAVDARLFACLFNRVRQGKLTLEQLRQAPGLRRQEGALMMKNSRRLFLEIWGSEPGLPAPWSGARLNMESGRGVWSLKIKEPAQMN